MTRDETTKVLSMLRSVWSHVEITDEKINAYHLALNHLTFELACTAAAQWIAVGKYFPVPAELLELVADWQAPAMSPGEAWNVVKKFIGRYGHDSGRDKLNELPAPIYEAVKMVGWRRICLDDNDKGFVTRDFERAYQGVTARMAKDLQIGSGHDAVIGLKAISD